MPSYDTDWKTENVWLVNTVVSFSDLTPNLTRLFFDGDGNPGNNVVKKSSVATWVSGCTYDLAKDEVSLMYKGKNYIITRDDSSVDTIKLTFTEDGASNPTYTAETAKVGNGGGYETDWKPVRLWTVVSGDADLPQDSLLIFGSMETGMADFEIVTPVASWTTWANNGTYASGAPDTVTVTHTTGKSYTISRDPGAESVPATLSCGLTRVMISGATWTAQEGG
ncbi:MAG TPA: hypothetical protein VLX28_13935 [Thermoanaerobaculia bacterium]|nr:hypothetical protein [Thermoanaerobaculia bacterium]